MQIPNVTKDQHPAARVGIFLVTFLPIYYLSYSYRLRHPYGAVKPPNRQHQPTDFVHSWLDVRHLTPFNPYPIAAYCNQSTWRTDLVFNLENANGGIGNVVGNTLDFLFFAIEAGASIILPGRAERAQHDLNQLWASRAPFDTFFDEQWFLKAMAEACPQMIIYKPEENMTLAQPLPGNYLPRNRRMDADKANTKKAYLEHLEESLKANEEYKPGELTLLNLERTLWDVDTRSLPLGFRRNFGQVLHVNPTLRRMAAVVVRSLAAKYRIIVDPTSAVPKRAFYGAHLRTESDAKSAGWNDAGNTNFSTQTDAYIAEAVKHGLGLIYVASGNASELERFREKAAAHRPALNVTTKFDLLPALEAQALKKMTWDQQALVDYEVLQRSSVFGGIVKSSFSYNIAITRNQWLEDQGRVLDPWYVTHSEKGVAFDDGISRIVGRDGWHEQRIPRGMFPWS